jgi:hypothetical protein
MNLQPAKVCASDLRETCAVSERKRGHSDFPARDWKLSREGCHRAFAGPATAGEENQNVPFSGPPLWGDNVSVDAAVETR